MIAEGTSLERRIERGPITLVGAGPTGTLLAILLQRRGFGVTLYDSRPDPRSHAGESGRSINLAMADRGIHALRAAGVFDAIAPEMVAMRGRFIHPLGASPSLQLYGQRPNEVIYSVSRHRLNQALLEVAAAQGVELHFEHRLEDADFAGGTALLRDTQRQRSVHVPMNPLLATDGAGSLTRRRMSALGLIRAREADLDHGYKELSIPAAANGAYAMPPEALHIWPRGDFMMIALPNRDGSFTATLFLAKHGEPSFETLTAPAAIEAFLLRQFPDAYALMPDCVAEFERHPTGFLGTVYADSWHVAGTAALIGDSAHAIVPFHGQGMNCCFEDCIEFDACVARHATWQAAFEEFFRNRKPNTDAIAAMALENYREMRERVIDPGFRLQQLLALDLEKRHPERFIPRYSMVMFHHEIPYHSALTRGATQAQILSTLTAGVDSLGDVDYELANRLIAHRLNPIAHDRA
jgi:kynurenine 3-monooxygenase